MPAARGSFNQSDAVKDRIGEASRKQWQDPKVRARRQEALKAAWARRREAMEVCAHCGQPLPEESGR